MREPKRSQRQEIRSQNKVMLKSLAKSDFRPQTSDLSSMFFENYTVERKTVKKMRNHLKKCRVSLEETPKISELVKKCNSGRV